MFILNLFECLIILKMDSFVKSLSGLVDLSLGELFCFFILETILIGRALKINPYDQPSVELIKKETKKILV